MIKRALLATIALTLGTLTTTAIAWYFAWTQIQLGTDPPDGSPGMRLIAPIPGPVVIHGKSVADAIVLVEFGSFPGTTFYEVARYDRAAVPDTFVSRGEVPIAGWVRPLAFPWESGASWKGDEDNHRTIIARGWPLPVLWSGSRLKSNSEMFDNGAFYFEGRLKTYGPRRPMVIYPSAAAYDVPFPLRPIWRHFIPSSLVWAVPWWVVFKSPGWIRAAWRRWKGRCVACGYSRAGLSSRSPCPECGVMQVTSHSS